MISVGRASALPITIALLWPSEPAQTDAITCKPYGPMRRLFAFALATLLTVPAYAEVRLSGNFTASQACPAYQSINRQTNPGNVETKPGQSYQLLAGNRDNPTHFSIVIPGASPDRRWVAVDCGTTDAHAATPQASTPTTRQLHYRGTQYILAVNWQPAFCETSPRKAECRAQRPDSFEATNFTLHGLWPQPRDNEYCDVSNADRRSSQQGYWRDLPQVPLSNTTRRELSVVMPGAVSQLDRHEWTKHGTCYGTSADEYYADALDMMEALNGSAVAELFASNIGRKITLAQVRTAFDQSFGRGAGERVSMDCQADGNRTVITELLIGLTGEITGPDDFKQLIAAASPVRSRCNSGMVDAVGIR
jgi:ribonuclease T2